MHGSKFTAEALSRRKERETILICANLLDLRHLRPLSLYSLRLGGSAVK